jgi:hypothetical protein
VRKKFPQRQIGNSPQGIQSVRVPTPTDISGAGLSRRIKKMTVSKAKKRAWSAFSLYIRLKYADKDGMSLCVTCGAIRHYKELQAGHMVPGRSNSILFDERGVFPQCVVCNLFKGGRPLEYQAFLRRRHGKEQADQMIEDMRIKSKIPRTMRANDFLLIELHYKQAVKNLQEGKEECTPLKW